jgi:hypothetical protein
MATGDFGDALPEPDSTVSGAHRRPPRLRVRAGFAIGALASFFGLTVATVAGALPAPLQEGLETFVELVTPIEIDHDVPEETPPQEEPSEPSGQFIGDIRINESDELPPDPADSATPSPNVTPGDEPLTAVAPDQVGTVASAGPLDTTDAGSASGDPTTDPTDEPSLVPETPGPYWPPSLEPEAPGLLGGGPPGLEGGGPPGFDGEGPPGLEGGLPPGHSSVRNP